MVKNFKFFYREIMIYSIPCERKPNLNRTQSNIYFSSILIQIEIKAQILWIGGDF